MTTKTKSEPTWQQKVNERTDRFNEVAATVLRYINSTPQARSSIAAYVLGLANHTSGHSWGELKDLIESFAMRGNIPTTLYCALTYFIEQEER